jgi:hypothetical protein
MESRVFATYTDMSLLACAGLIAVPVRENHKTKCLSNHW